MSGVLRIVAGVGTPIALLGFLVALSYYAYVRRMEYEEKKLEALPPDERAARTDKYLTRYKIDGKNLRIEDKVALIREEMDKGHRRSLGYVIIAAIVFTTCFGLSALAFVIGRSHTSAQITRTNPESSSSDNQLDAVGEFEREAQNRVKRFRQQFSLCELPSRFFVDDKIDLVDKFAQQVTDLDKSVTPKYEHYDFRALESQLPAGSENVLSAFARLPRETAVLRQYLSSYQSTPNEQGGAEFLRKADQQLIEVVRLVNELRNQWPTQVAAFPTQCQ